MRYVYVQRMVNMYVCKHEHTLNLDKMFIVFSTMCIECLNSGLGSPETVHLYIVEVLLRRALQNLKRIYTVQHLQRSICRYFIGMYDIYVNLC